MMRCVACGIEQLTDSKVCTACSEPLTQSAPAASVRMVRPALTRSPSASPSATGADATCPGCGATSEADGEECEVCGYNQSEASSTSQETAGSLSPTSAATPADVPRSSVEATFVIRRRPRLLAYLVEREGELVGRVHQLRPDLTEIGRDPRNDIVLADVLVSGFHVRVERDHDEGFVVEDRQSTNGTWLNGEPLTGPHPVRENDRLRLGNTTLVLKTVD